MNETIVAKGLAKHLAEKYEGFGGEYIKVKNMAETKEHGYTDNGATIISEELPNDKHDAPWTYDTSGELLKWVQAKYGNEYWLEAYSHWLLCINKS